MVLLLALAQDDDAPFDGVGQGHAPLHIVGASCVQVQPAARDQGARLLLGTLQPACHGQVNQAQPLALQVGGGHSAGRHLGEDVEQVVGAQPGQVALAKEHFGRLLRLAQAVFAVHRPRDFLGQAALCNAQVRFRGHGPFQRGDLVAIQQREVLEVWHHISIGRVEPVLVEAEGRRAPGVEPHRPGLGLAELDAGRGGDQRHGESVGFAVGHFADQLGAGGDVAPLIAAAHLERAAVVQVQAQEVVGLQQHVAELGERQALLALQPRLDRVLGRHVVDGEVLADVAQELDQVELAQPVGVVEQQRRVGHALEGQEVGELDLDSFQVAGKLLLGE